MSKTAPIPRTQEFTKTANALSDFIATLPLTKEQNDRLVQLAVEHSQAAERSGFIYAAELVIKAMRPEQGEGGGLVQ